MLTNPDNLQAPGMSEIVPAAAAKQHVPSYLDWARSNRGSGWFYFAGAAMILGIWLASSVLVVLIAIVAIGPDFDADSGTFGPTWLNNLVQLSTFLPFFFATLVIVGLFHGRPWRSIITPFRRIRVHMILAGAGIWGGLLALSLVISLPFSSELPRWDFNAVPFFANLAVVVVFLFFQTTAEELFFRGYLGSWLSLRLKNVWVQSAIIGVLFMIPHLANPEVLALSGWMYLFGASTYFAVGFGWMFVSHTTGSIELAIGAHFINNFLVMVMLGSSDGSLGGASLWVVDAAFAPIDALGSWLVVILFILIAFRLRGSGEVVPVMPPAAPKRPVYPVYAWVSPPGWYWDPWRQATYRYWDGYYWTPWVHNPPSPSALHPPTTYQYPWWP